MKIIMYHYVRNFDELHSRLNILDLKTFEKQLNYFEKKFGFISKNIFEEIFLKKNFRTFSENKNKILLTFDDATNCHYNVFKELKRRKIFGIFNVASKPYVENKLLNVNRIQILTSKVPAHYLYKFLKEILSKDMFVNNLNNNILNLPYKQNRDNSDLIEFKKILNYQLKGEIVEKIIDEVEKKFNLNKTTIEWYLKEDQIKEMSRNGMLFGSHTNSHYLMSNCEQEAQLKEIKLASNYLNKIIDQEAKIYCHPFGRFYSFNKQTLSILSKLKFDLALNVESRDMNLNDINTNIYTLPRYNCNEFLNIQI